MGRRRGGKRQPLPSRGRAGTGGRAYGTHPGAEAQIPISMKQRVHLSGRLHGRRGSISGVYGDSTPKYDPHVTGFLIQDVKNVVPLT